MKSLPILGGAPIAAGPIGELSAASAASGPITDTWAGAGGNVNGKTPTTGGGTWGVSGATTNYGSGYASSTGGNSVVLHSATYTNATFSSSEIVPGLVGASIDAPLSLIGRAADAAADTCYRAVFSIAGTPSVTLYKVITGVWTQLASVDLYTANLSASLTIVGSTITVSVSSTAVITVNDTSITAAGYWGFGNSYGESGEDIGNSSIGPVSLEQVTASNVTLVPSLYTNTQTFFSASLTNSYALTPALFTNSQMVYGPTLNATYSLTPSLYTNGQTYYAPTVTAGTAVITPSLFTNSQTFYSAAISQGAPSQTLAASLFTNSPTFYAATVTPGSLTVAPALITNSQTFYDLTLGSSYTLTSSVYVNADGFFSPTVQVVSGTQTLLPTLLGSTLEIYAAQVSQPNQDVFDKVNAVVGGPGVQVPLSAMRKKAQRLPEAESDDEEAIALILCALASSGYLAVTSFR